MKTDWSWVLLFCAALWGGAPALPAQVLTAGSVGAIDAEGHVAFSLTFDQDLDFRTVDSVGRQALSFQFYLSANPAPPTIATRPFLSLIRGDEIASDGDIVVRNDSPRDPAPASGGWGTVRGRVRYATNGRTLTFSVPATVLNVSGPFTYRVETFSYGGSVGSYTGTAGGPILFTAPASFARTVYRDKGTALRSLPNGKTSSPAYVPVDNTIIFEDETRFTYLVARQVTDRTANGKLQIQPPRPDGKYRVTRISNNLVLLTLNVESVTPTSMRLIFTNPTTGTGDGIDGQLTFSLSELPAANLAAARNVSMRGTASPGRPLVVGFVTAGAREVLIRAVGPSLRQFGITTAWSDPDFQLYDGNYAYQPGLHNADWDAGTNISALSDSKAALAKIFSYLGAFPLPDGSKDAADVVRLDPGAYTITCAPAPGDAGGEVLVEVYFLP